MPARFLPFSVYLTLYAKLFPRRFALWVRRVRALVRGDADRFCYVIARTGIKRAAFSSISVGYTTFPPGVGVVSLVILQQDRTNTDCAQRLKLFFNNKSHRR